MRAIKINKWLTILVLLAITLFIINPKDCISATSNGLRIWSVNVVPALFPFFILTRIIIVLNQTSIPTLDKFTTKFFHAKHSGLVYFLSLLSGYPIGAKMISSYYDNGIIDQQTASKMFSFCSTSGPMFIIGTVGIGVFGNATIGYIILVGHICGSFLNGLCYRGKTSSNGNFKLKLTKTNFNDIVFDSINSILLVGGYIVFSAVVLQLLQEVGITSAIAKGISNITHCDYDLAYSVVCGIIEITNGLILLGQTLCNTTVKMIVASGLIAFSGICIMLQSLGYLNKIGIKKSTILLQKTTQTIFTILATFLIGLLFKI